MGWFTKFKAWNKRKSRRIDKSFLIFDLIIGTLSLTGGIIVVMHPNYNPSLGGLFILAGYSYIDAAKLAIRLHRNEYD